MVTKDEEQDEAIAALQKENAKHTNKSDEILKSFDTSTPMVNGVAGTEQRLLIHVPSPQGKHAQGDVEGVHGHGSGTSMALGAPLEGVNNSGFGVSTFGHISMSGVDPSSTVSIVSQDQVLIQSVKKALYLVSKGPATLASADDLSLISTKGITIGAGWTEGRWWGGITGRDPVMEDHAGYRERTSKITELWGERDGNVAIAGGVRSLVFDFLGAKVWDAALAGVGLAVGKWDYDVSPNVTIHGPDGFLLGTHKFGAIYAGVGIDMVAPYVGVVGLKDAEVAGIHSASLVGGVEASVGAIGAAEVVSFAGGTEIASRHGDVEVVGKTLQLGKAVIGPPKWSVPSFGWMKQVPTQKTQVEATNLVSLATGAGTAAPTSPGIHLVSHEVIELRAAKALDVSAGQTAVVWAGREFDSNQSAQLGVDAVGSTVTAKVAQSSVEVSDKKGVSIRVGESGAVVYIKKDQIVLAFHAGKGLILGSDGSLKFGGQTVVVKP